MLCCLFSSMEVAIIATVHLKWLKVYMRNPIHPFMPYIEGSPVHTSVFLHHMCASIFPALLSAPNTLSHYWDYYTINLYIYLYH